MTAPSLTAFLRPILATQPDHIEYMEDWVGRYPFDVYGSLVPDEANIGFALETQTISLYDDGWFTQNTQGVLAATMVHESAHMWFGNSVTPYEWSDLWFNEGHASWSEFLFAEENGQLEEDTENWPDDTGATMLEEINGRRSMTDEEGDELAAGLRVDLRRSARRCLRTSRCTTEARSSCTRCGRRSEPRVRATERELVRRYRDGVLRTADFIALASHVSRRDLSGYLRAWIYGETKGGCPATRTGPSTRWRR